ncbi:MAG: T9SS type A sorting domain-containing protein [Bacteroidia bacterium]
MKKIVFYFALIFFLSSFSGFSQNWGTFGGSSSRNGLSKITGPQNVTSTFWNINSSNLTTLGNAVYTFGDKFVTSRVKFSPYTGLIECRDLQNGSLIWETPFISNTSILYCIGFNEDGVYAHDYDSDTIYAFNVDDGTIKWSSQLTSQTFGAYPGCVFACNGDLIVNGPGPAGMSTMRLNKYTGDTVWTNANTFSIGPAVGLAASETTVYRITGAVTSPIRLTTIDINTGATKYFTPHIPGDPDQENPITIGSGGEIYFWRDGGNLFAYEDNGTGLLQTWFYVPQTTTGAAFYGNIAEGVDGNLYVFDSGKIRRIDYTSGGVLDSSIININQGSISVGADSTVYVDDQNGMFYALSYDLQTVKWQLAVGSNYYCNPALAKDGIMIMTGGGYNIKAYKPTLTLKPVADFRASATKVFTNQLVDFFDQSSYSPTSWQWYFPGANTTTSTQQNPTGTIYSTPGIYKVTLVADNSNGSDSVTKACYIEVEVATAINEFMVYGLQFTVYPNPADEFVVISSEFADKSRIKIFDVNGKEVFKQELSLLSGSRLRTSDFPNGIYLLQLISNENIFMKKIIIQHD